MLATLFSKHIGIDHQNLWISWPLIIKTVKLHQNLRIVDSIFPAMSLQLKFPLYKCPLTRLEKMKSEHLLPVLTQIGELPSYHN